MKHQIKYDKLSILKYLDLIDSDYTNEPALIVIVHCVVFSYAFSLVKFLACLANDLK